MNRLPPPRGSPGYMSRLYRSNLRPFILFGAFIAFLWTLVAGISSFRNVPFLDSNNEKRLGVLYIILGALFMGIAVIEAFGIFAAATQRLGAVRTFSYLSILVALMVAAAYIIQTVAHYTFKTDIINLCTNANSGDHIFFIGFFGPIDGGVVTPLEAQEWCTQQFNRDSFSNIVALLVTTAIAIIFAMIVFAYLRQLRDPSSAANVSREPVRTNAYSTPYNNYNPAYNPAYQFPAPNGPPPGVNDSDAFVPPYRAADKPPKYEGDFKGSFGDQKDPFGNDYYGSGGRSMGDRPY